MRYITNVSRICAVGPKCSLESTFDIVARIHYFILGRSRLGNAARDRLQFDIVISAKEQGYGVPAHAASINGTMDGRFEDVISPAGKLVAEVDDEGSVNRWCINPFLISIENL